MGAKPAEGVLGIVKFEEISDFAGFIQHDYLVQLYVYNIDSEKVRVVDLLPNCEWGGQGLLGCDVVKGMMHTIPVRRQNLWSH